MDRSSWKKLAVIFILLGYLAFHQNAHNTAAEAASINQAVVVYLPIISKIDSGIFGRVTEGGNPAANVQLELYDYDGNSSTSVMTVETNEHGSFRFTGVPDLQPGHTYSVIFQNKEEESSNRLWVWSTRELIAYTQGTSVEIGNFDIADVVLNEPAYGASVTTPVTFRWTPRTATPSDIYEFNLYDFTDIDPFFYTDPPLGYVDSYTLNELPQGFVTGEQYAWEVWVFAPDGGYGISWELRDVRFTKAGINTAPDERPQEINFRDRISFRGRSSNK